MQRKIDSNLKSGAGIYNNVLDNEGINLKKKMIKFKYNLAVRRPIPRVRN